MLTHESSNKLQTGENVPFSELTNRIALLQAYLTQYNIDAGLILQNSDLYYFSGISQPGYLYVPADGHPILMVLNNIAHAKVESNLEKVMNISSLSQIPSLLKDNGLKLPHTLGMELDVLTLNIYQTFKDLFETTQVGHISHYIRLVRMIKSPFEIERLTQASKLVDQLASYVKEDVHEGITEIELAGKLEARARKLGHDGLVRMRHWGHEIFYGHLMSGPTASVPSALSSPTGGTGMSPAFPQGPSTKKIRHHEPILFDYFFAHKRYLADLTRIFSIGELPDDLMEAHQSMLDLQEILKKKMLPGLTSNQAYDLSLEFINQTPYADAFMGAEDPRIRFVGHGVGLEADEYPFIAEGHEIRLKENMVIALEPKLVFPGIGVVGVENTHLVTKDGLRPLTRYPEEIEIL
jgi:Xaa-Pro aminopeptidase